jgi:hypothetical protein
MNKFFIIRNGEGDYDDYQEYTCAVLLGPADANLDELCNQCGQSVVERTGKKHWRYNVAEFVSWLVDKKGFETVPYEEWVR